MRYVLFLIFSLLSLFAFSDNASYGLFLRSYPANTTLWSELEIENGEPFRLHKQFSIAFDVLIREECPFGYIFRAITDKNEHIDLFLSVGDNNERFPSLSVQDFVYTLSEEFERNKWLSAKIEINTSKQRISFLFGNQRMEIPYKDQGAKSIRFVFGKSNVTGLETKDIASVNLRDIKIERNRSLIRHWPLKKHHKNISYDEIENVPAITKNAEWLIDNHVILKPIFKKKFQLAPSVGFNSKTGVFYLTTNSEEIVVFYAKDMSMDTLLVKGGNLVTQSPNQLMFIDKTNDLISYRINRQVYSFYDFETNRWSNEDIEFRYSYEHDYWNNSANFYQKDSTILSFGGYGYYRFNNNLVTTHPYETDIENTYTDLKNITPRCASATVIVGDTLYIFGGHGSTSGHQELGPENYYDFYAVDLRTLRIQKLWNMSTVESSFLPSENMIYDRDQHCFYTFITQNGGKVIKLYPHQNFKEDLSFPLDIDFSTQYQYTNFYYSAALKKYYVYINQINVDNTAEVRIYSIDSPLIPLNKALIHPPEIRKPLLNYLATVFFLTAALTLFIYFLRRKKNLKLTVDDTGKIIEEIDNKDIESHKNYPKNIYFFGLFQVFDKHGNDISDDFSPTLRSLLILLITYTQNEKGISGKEMMRILWPDKDDKLAKNSRNVYISKLRTLLEKIEDIVIVNKNKVWSIEIGGNTSCDYLDILKLSAYADYKQLSNGQINEIIYLLSRGALLTDFEYEWLDKYKSDFSNRTIDMLYHLLEDKTLQDNIKLKICDILFQLDFLNERALFYKCKILNNHGKKGIAKNVYDSFCVEYQNSLGISYAKSFVDVLRLKLHNE